MATRVQKPGIRTGADFLYHVQPRDLAKAGVEVVGFYLKRATREQVKAYHDAGLSVFMIHQRGYEGSGPTPAQSGAKHGAEASAQAVALGYPKGLPIVFASMGDYDNTGRNIAGSVAYWDAAKKANTTHASGAYGDWELLQQVGPRSALNVQAAAKGWSWDWAKNKWKGPHPTAHMLQHPSIVFSKPTTEWPGTRIDPLTVLRPFVAWAGEQTLTAPHQVIRLTKPLTKSPYVEALSRCLVAYGWYSGVQDEYGPNLENAWRQTQKRFGIPVTGVYDELGRVKLQQYINTHPVTL